ncbi:MAG: FAD-binding oxidoreductase, partial [Bryobacteraceae bacterium]
MEIAGTKGSRPVFVDEAEVADLRARMRGPLLRPGDPGYDGARVIFNGMFDRRPALIARCRGLADVIDAVQFARRHHLLIAVRAGGHSVAGNSMCDQGMVIDLSQMNAVSVDLKRRIARVQG